MRIFENSYIVSIIVFIVLYILFYFSGIGFTKTMVNGKPVEKYGWKYPLAGALIVWVVWHYYLYPVPDDTPNVTNTDTQPVSIQRMQQSVPRINMVTWH